jgi:hypothetical protein
VFNYSSPIVHADLLDTFEGKTITGALDYIGRPTWEICLDVIDKTPGNKFVATTKRGFPDPPEGVKIKHILRRRLRITRLGRRCLRILTGSVEGGDFYAGSGAVDYWKGVGKYARCCGSHQKRGLCKEGGGVAVISSWNEASEGNEC